MHAFSLVACVMVIQAQTKCFYFLAFEIQKIGVTSVCPAIALIKSKNTDILTCDRKDANTLTYAYTNTGTHATYKHKIDDDTKSRLAKRGVKRVVAVVLSIS